MQTGLEGVTTDSLPAALFAAAILAECHGLGFMLRSRIFARIGTGDVSQDVNIVDSILEAAQTCRIPCSINPLPWTSRLRKARTVARKWADAGVRVMALREVITTGPDEPLLPEVLFAWGNAGPLEYPGAAVLQSRRKRDVHPHDEWVRTIKRFVDHACGRGFSIITSNAPLTYSLVCRRARGSPVVVVCDEVLPFLLNQKKVSQFLDTYGDLFDLNLTLFLSPFSPGDQPSRPQRMALRDSIVARLASVIYAGEVRKGGNMERVLKAAYKRGTPVLGIDAGTPDHRITRLNLFDDRENRFVRSKMHVSASRLSCAKTCATANRSRASTALECEKSIPRARLDNSSYLIHYTRRCPGPWPGQTLGEYCQTLIDGNEDAAHTAFDTLNRIMTERRVRASSRLIRGAFPVVSFTERLPEELKSVIAWRKGLTRWTFEPYGIAVKKEVLAALGARPVLYGNELCFRSLSKEEKYLFQFTKLGNTDWKLEKEWRLPNDLDLTVVSQSDLILALPTREEAIFVANRYNVSVTWPELFSHLHHAVS